jgi:hypothetical protein
MPEVDWRVGPLRGHVGKAEAEFIGERAREAARLRWLSELSKRRDDLLTLSTAGRGATRGGAGHGARSAGGTHASA